MERKSNNFNNQCLDQPNEGSDQDLDQNPCDVFKNLAFGFPS